MKPARLPLLLLALTAAPAGAASWEEVAPVFTERCVLCHAGEDAPLALRLDSHDGVLAGSENGPVLDLATPDASPLIQRLRGEAEPRMPLDGPPFLDAPRIAAIAAWIAAGAPGPRSAAPVPIPVPAAPPDPYADGHITYGEVARIFAQRCIECHSDNSKMGAPPEGLRLTTLAEILSGGERVAVIPGNPQASGLIRRVEGLADPRMPLDGPPFLDANQTALLRDWIAGGALDDDFTAAAIPVGRELRLRGVMTAPDAIDGARFTLTPRSRIDDRPAAGQQAEVRGRVGPDGGIIAERLRRR